jgi:hypothetical protein
MKTAMQELIDELKLIEAYPMSPLVLRMATDLLDKEKEQIMDSYLQGSFDDGPNITNSEQYYNQTYNQTNVGNDGFEFDNSSTIPPPKTNNL